MVLLILTRAGFEDARQRIAPDADAIWVGGDVLSPAEAADLRKSGINLTVFSARLDRSDLWWALDVVAEHHPGSVLWVENSAPQRDEVLDGSPLRRHSEAIDFPPNQRPRAINFYRVGEAFGEFSNFAPYPIRLKERTWPTSEHYFQAQKFAGTPDEEAVRSCKTAMAAAKMGRERSRPLRPDWETVKNGVMHEAVLAKFEQHAKLRDLLLSTGDALIIEHTRNDPYWGDGGDGSGRNMLGHILMKVRSQLAGG